MSVLYIRRAKKSTRMDKYRCSVAEMAAVEITLKNHRLSKAQFSASAPQADALEIEAAAKRRLADEYDAAQERGEVAGRKGGGERSGLERSPAKPPASLVGVTRKQIHEARAVRDAPHQ